MPHPSIEVMRLEEAIDDVLDARAIIQADRSMYRRMEAACTEKLKALKQVYLELENALAALLPQPLICAV